MNSEKTVNEITAMIEKYRESVVNADNPDIAGQVWTGAPEDSFIHPRGYERGFARIRANFYEKTMNSMFSRRDLRVSGKPLVRVFGETALAEFDWEFTAESRADGSLRKTAGRESQLYVNMPELGWRLTHVHYSALPAGN